jgi:hypothetical protein
MLLINLSYYEQRMLDEETLELSELRDLPRTNSFHAFDIVRLSNDRVGYNDGKHHDGVMIRE